MSAHYTRVKSISLDVIEDTVYHYVKKNPQTSLLDVANQTGLMEFQVKKAWRTLAKAGELPVLPNQRTQAKKVVPTPGKVGRKPGPFGHYTKHNFKAECDAIVHCLQTTPGISVRAIAKKTGMREWTIYRARKVLENLGEIGTPTTWGSGPQHKTYTNFLLTVLAPV